MLTHDEIQNAVLNANYVLATKVNADLVLMHKGCTPSWTSNMNFNVLIKALQYQDVLQDYSSDLTYSLYTKVLKCSGFTGDIPGINQNFQSPTVIIQPINPYTPTPPLIKTQENLVYDGSQWYLPYLDSNNQPIPTNLVPALVKSNNVSFTFGFDASFTPPRIYGFGNNDPQSIVVYFNQ